MSNRIVRVEVTTRRLSPVEAELWVAVEAEALTPATDVRGRLVGPRCAGVTTVEVAYPLRPLPRPPEGLPPLTRRVVIPEPSLWEEKTPFVYRAFIELWEGDERRDTRECDVGLRPSRVP